MHLVCKFPQLVHIMEVCQFTETLADFWYATLVRRHR